jgi:hypothetical protein
MKILVIQTNGIHDANRHFRECFSIQRALQSLDSNIACDIWGPGHSNFNTEINFNSYDIIFSVEQRDFSGWFPYNELKNSKAYKIQWAIDSHSLTSAPFDYLCREGNFQLQLQSCVEYCTDNSKPWFPNCYDDDLIKPIDNIVKQYDIGFCGSAGGPREELIDNLVKKYNLKKDIFVIGNQMVETINSYKIHFNKNVLFDINYRTFETAGCKTTLLTNFHPKLSELGFIDEVNCIVYKDVNELVEKIEQYIKLDNSNIALNGFNLVSQKHTYKTRIKTLLAFLKNKI